MSEIRFVGKTRYEDLTETGSYVPVPNRPKDTINVFCFLAHRVSNLNVMSENRDKVYDPVPGPTPGN